MDGKFGAGVVLKRGTRFIYFTKNVWAKLRRHVPMLKTVDYRLQLTDAKDVAVIMFNDVQYVGFHNTYKHEGEVKSSYINLKPDEWARFLAALEEIDALLPPQNIILCPGCKLMKTFMRVSHGRMLLTKLSPDKLQVVHESNNATHNHSMMHCEYCGEYMLCNDGKCHSHLYACRDCEPENFCTTCGSIKVFGL